MHPQKSTCLKHHAVDLRQNTAVPAHDAFTFGHKFFVLEERPFILGIIFL
jgi:hypothetical protein